ncbi:MAG: 50S ribosomal protein L25/general stress protein Ctc [Gammaproteobacteria bacterium]|jgi:large subunit ribosomal protein L25|nr:50S ribosomal protein L25/general stress protein Ctc [Gammaproteobacteria bacterium]
MAINFELRAESRQDAGKGASRRLRRAGKVPAILYGGTEAPVMLALEHNPVMHSLENEAFYSHVLTVDIDGKKVSAVLKDLQRHPYKRVILHLDLQRISATEKLRMSVPLHFVGADVAPGVKQAGGLVEHLLTEVAISCLPKDLPEYLEVDVSGLNVNETLHLSNIRLPAGVELVDLQHGPEHDLPVVSIHLPRAAVEAASGEGEEAAGEGSAP